MEVLAAVWCADSAGFDAALRPAISAQGARFLRTRDAMPLGPFLSRYPQGSDPQTAGIALARDVGPQVPVSLGTVRRLREAGGGPSASAKGPPAVERLAAIAPLAPAPFQDAPNAPAARTVPDLLRDPLFGQTDPADPAPPLHTYAILDAARNPRLPYMLEASNLPYRCLFDGDAFRDLRSVAPYLVALNESSSFTRHLFTGASASLNASWDMEHGPFLRSPRPFAALHAHLSGCLMTRSTDGSPAFFRFWEDCVLDYIGFFGGRSLGRKLFPGMVLIWNTRYFNAGKRFVMTRIDAP